jgi:hypothetical protein
MNLAGAAPLLSVPCCGLSCQINCTLSPHHSTAIQPLNSTSVACQGQAASAAIAWNPFMPCQTAGALQEQAASKSAAQRLLLLVTNKARMQEKKRTLGCPHHPQAKYRESFVLAARQHRVWRVRHNRPQSNTGKSNVNVPSSTHVPSVMQQRQTMPCHAQRPCRTEKGLGDQPQPDAPLPSSQLPLPSRPSNKDRSSTALLLLLCFCSVFAATSALQLPQDAAASSSHGTQPFWGPLPLCDPCVVVVVVGLASVRRAVCHPAVGA